LGAQNIFVLRFPAVNTEIVFRQCRPTGAANKRFNFAFPDDYANNGIADLYFVHIVQDRGGYLCPVNLCAVSAVQIGNHTPVMAHFHDAMISRNRLVVDANLQVGRFRASDNKGVGVTDGKSFTLPKAFDYLQSQTQHKSASPVIHAAIISDLPRYKFIAARQKKDNLL
jgi:hypothetical protein